MARTASSAAKRAPRSAPATKVARADLAIVAHRRRITPTMVVATVLALAVAFGALSVQISLIHRQQRLDSVRAEITEVQQANKELRQKESRLQAPAEILRIARDELGMVESKPPELVTPAVETVGAIEGTAPTGATTTPEPTDDGAPATDD